MKLPDPEVLSTLEKCWEILQHGHPDARADLIHTVRSIYCLTMNNGVEVREVTTVARRLYPLHPTTGAILKLVNRGIRGSAKRDLEKHLAGCSGCRETFIAFSRESLKV
jgi:hypothetical protein